MLIAGKQEVECNSLTFVITNRCFQYTAVRNEKNTETLVVQAN